MPERLELLQGTLDVLIYPALHRLEKQGWLSAEWKASETNRRAKYYQLTPRGRKQLVAEQGKWDLLVKTIARIMKPARIYPVLALREE